MRGRRAINGLKTTMLFMVMWVLVMAIGSIVGLGTGNMPAMMVVFAGLGLLMTFIGYWNSDKIAIKAMRAYPVTREQAPEMYRAVSELSARADQPMPRLYISPTKSPNAFATGRNPKNAAVCCTEGILSLLDERELRGVLGHELMHVYNRDILTSAVAAGLAGLITTLARMMFWFGGMGGGRGRRNNGAGALIGLLGMILLPLAAMLIQLGISRTREFSADHDGAALTNDPLALASALRKLEAGIDSAPLPSNDPQFDAVSHVMIANPFGRRRSAMSGMFSTHPPTAERVRRLEDQARGRG